MTPTTALLLSLVALLLEQQAPPRDLHRAADAARGTAAVRGRVLDKDSGAPIPRATVFLVRMSGPDSPQRRFARSGDDGRFEFLEVLAGSYHLGADTGEDRPTHLMQLAGTDGPTQRLAPLVPSATIDIKDGEARSDLDVRLSRALAIAGVVVNDHGEPLANMEVRAELIRGGRIVRRSALRRTDDRGEFRLFGLPPGRYRVCALSPPPYIRSPVFRERLVSTCHPSATREQDAALVVLGPREEPQVQIRMQVSALFTLSGTVLNTTGAPAAGAAIRVSTRNRLDVFGMSYRAGPDGRFKVTDLVPGEYHVEASAPAPNEPSGHRGEFALEAVSVGGADLDVVLSMSRTARLAGHVMFEGAPAPPPGSRRQLSVVALGAPRAPRTAAARVQADLTFELDELLGAQLLDVTNAPEGWVLKSVRYAGADITDAPAELRSSGDPRQLQITLTTRGGSIGGRVVDAEGNPVPGARVLTIPAEPARWPRLDWDATMRVARDGGTFAFPPKRPGEYLIVALAQDDAPDGPLEREDVELLARIAERIALAEGETRAVTLRLTELPEDR